MTAEEYIINELEHEKSLRKDVENSMFIIRAQRNEYKYLLIQICKNIIIKDSPYIGRYFDFEYNVGENEHRNPELFTSLVDFMKQNGIIKDEEQEESEDKG